MGWVHYDACLQFAPVLKTAHVVSNVLHYKHIVISIGSFQERLRYSHRPSLERSHSRLPECIRKAQYFNNPVSLAKSCYGLIKYIFNSDWMIRASLLYHPFCKCITSRPLDGKCQFWWHWQLTQVRVGAIQYGHGLLFHTLKRIIHLSRHSGACKPGRKRAQTPSSMGRGQRFATINWGIQLFRSP